MSLPKELQRDKGVAWARLNHARQINLLALSLQVEGILEFFPNDPLTDLAQLDCLVARGRGDELLKVVDRIEKRVGNDPYLDTFRGRAHSIEKRFDDAKRLARQAIEEEPWIADPYWLLVDISLAEKDFDETVVRLNAIETRLGVPVPVESINKSASCAEFVESRAFQSGG